ncbi:unnamed protein product [Zymoseptoria tritici ST99CH_3D1]|nr:unnamed protein product [Zymoseptoria tritici ST99CH_3D1]
MDISKTSKEPNYAEKASSPAERDDLSWEDPRVKAIKRRVDIRLCGILSLMYIANLIDRTNLPNAVIAGMEDTLHLTGTNRYTVIVLVFFPSYVLFQPIATVLARRLGPRSFLAGITLAFGLVVLGFGFVDDWKKMVGLRVLLGAFESCYFPSAYFLVSMWYVRREVAKRLAFFFLIGNTAGGFGGLLAHGLSQMAGVNGIEGWRWIFIWESVITVIVALIGYVFLVDFPEDASKTKFFLNAEEVKIMVERIERDRGDAHLTPFNLKHYLSQGKDWMVWFFAANAMLSGVTAYAVTYFLPIILRKTLHFTVVEAQCLTAPCFAFAFLLGFLQSYLSDKYNVRGALIIINSIIEIIGIAILGYAKAPYVRYFGAYLLTGGAFSNVPAGLTYQANNVVGQWRRAFTSASIIAASGVGGVIGTVVFRPQDAPTYGPGLWTCFVAAGLTIVSVVVTTVYMWRMNKKQARGEVVIEGVVGFRYTL